MFGEITKPLATYANAVDSLVEKAKRKFGDVDTTDQMENIVQNIYTKKYKTNVNEHIRNPSALSQDAPLFNDPSFMEELNELMAQVEENYERERAQAKASEFIPPAPSTEGIQNNSSSSTETVKEIDAILMKLNKSIGDTKKMEKRKMKQKEAKKKDEEKEDEEYEEEDKEEYEEGKKEDEAEEDESAEHAADEKEEAKKEEPPAR